MRLILRSWLRFATKIYLFKYKPFVIAVTGNTGKTSTKEAIYCLLEDSFPGKIVKKSPKNLNTDIGVPLTILSLKNVRSSLWGWILNILKSIKILIYDQNPADYLILELAADKPGEIKYFTEFLKIDIGVVTSIGEHPVHLEFFENRDSLIQEKTWLVKGVKKEGVVILNYDDKDVRKMAKARKRSVKALFYGRNNKADISFEFSGYDLKKDNIFLKASFQENNNKITLKLKNLLGHGSLYALGAALLCGTQLSVPFKRGIKILERKYKTPAGRMKVLTGIKNSIIIDDSYNASPLAFKNALNTLQAINAQRRKVAILGDMAELGDDSAKIHLETVKQAQKVADMVFCVGPKMTKAFKQAVKNKRSDIGNYQAQDSNLAKKKIKALLKKNDIILIKGAQVSRAERIVKELLREQKKAKELLVRQDQYWLSNP